MGGNFWCNKVSDFQWHLCKDLFNTNFNPEENLEFLGRRLVFLSSKGRCNKHLLEEWWCLFKNLWLGHAKEGCVPKACSRHSVGLCADLSQASPPTFPPTCCCSPQYHLLQRWASLKYKAPSCAELSQIIEQFYDQNWDEIIKTHFHLWPTQKLNKLPCLFEELECERVLQ